MQKQAIGQTFGDWSKIKVAVGNLKGSYIRTINEKDEFSVQYENLIAYWNKEGIRYEIPLIVIYSSDLYDCLNSNEYDVKLLTKELPATTVDVILENVIKVPLSIKRTTLQNLEANLKFIHPNYEAIKKFGNPGNWDGYYRLYTYAPKYFTAPIGLLFKVKQILESDGYKVNVNDNRATTESTINFQFDMKSLRDYQIEAVKSAAYHKGGIVVAPAGSGKTIIGKGIIKCFNTRTLILVHTLDLLEQWKERLKPNLVGTVYSGQKIFRPITIAMIQTVNNILSHEELKRFGLIITDECHHIPATMFRTVIRSLPAKYKFGLTATPERTDHLEPILFSELSSIIYDISAPKLIEEERLMKPLIYKVETDLTVYGSYHSLAEQLVDHKERNQLIIDIAKEEIDEGHYVLILTNRKKHCKVLQDLAPFKAEIATSAVSKDKRKKILESMRKGEIKCIIATQLADEGLDIPILDRVILTYPTNAWTRCYQRIGRIMRPFNSKKDSIAYDIVDINAFSLSSFFLRKQKVYDKHQMEVVKWKAKSHC